MAKIDLDSTELSVGGVKLKGVYIAVVFSFATTIAGGIFAASKFIHRIDSLEEKVSQIKMPDGEPVVKLIEKVDTIEAEVSQLQADTGKHTESLTNTQKELAELSKEVNINDVSSLQGTIATLKTSMDGVNNFTKEVQTVKERIIVVEKDMQTLKKDVDSQWSAIDSIGAGSLKGK